MRKINEKNNWKRANVEEIRRNMMEQETWRRKREKERER
jgi:hypothetical protein